MGFSCRLVGFTVVTLILWGCGGAPAPAKDPADLLKNYAQALRDGDADRAWAMLDEDAKRDTTFEAFRRWLQGNPAEANRLATTLERPTGPAVVTARVFISDGAPLEFVEQEGTLRIRLSSLDRYSQQTPQCALTSFVLAVKHRRYDVLLRLTPANDRVLLTERRLAEAFEGAEREQIAALVRSIELALPSGRVDVQGKHATFDLGAGSQLTLLLQDGVWTIEDYLPIIR